MSGTDKQPLLSICIPTWNRATFLRLSFDSFLEQMRSVNRQEIELFVSDNCSDDETQMVVKEYIQMGLPITYNRNEENIGAARNFIKCMQYASGKYIYLLGDDDILEDGALVYLLAAIRNKDYGLIHIHEFEKLTKELNVYVNPETFLSQISYWITFMSGSIFRKDVVAQIDPSRYVGTHLLQIPFYIASALSRKENLIINKSILKAGLDSGNNGGYNFYEVFVKNYLNIWKINLDSGHISLSLYKAIKKDIYIHFIVEQSYILLVQHNNVKDEKSPYIGNRQGFKIAGAKEIIEDYYGGEWYHKLYWWWNLRMWWRYQKKQIKIGAMSKLIEIKKYWHQ